MSRGYAEGSAIEERLAALDRGDGQGTARKSTRAAVYASTPDDPERHFISWADEIDADELFSTGDAWGIQIRRVAAE